MTEAFPMLPLGLSPIRRRACRARRSGRKKSDFERMIACIAIEHEAALVTRICDDQFPLPDRDLAYLVAFCLPCASVKAWRNVTLSFDHAARF